MKGLYMNYMSKVLDSSFNLSIPRVAISAGITGLIYWFYLATIVKFFGSLITEMKGSDFLDMMFSYVFTTQGMISTGFFIIINCTLIGLLFGFIHNLISTKD